MSSLFDKIDELRKKSEGELAQATTEEAAESLRIRYLGKRGLLTDLLKEVGQVDPALRPQIGQAVNEFKIFFQNRIQSVLTEQKTSALIKKLQEEKIDITLPGRRVSAGHSHPITQVLSEVSNFFLHFGFDVHAGPEIETDYFNFEALNMGADHPARDMQDTFYLQSIDSLQSEPATSSKENAKASLLLRTHTSPVQVRVMAAHQPPIRMIAPGVVYRRDSDITHTPMFHQVEGLWVDEKISMADLKGVLTEFLQTLFDSSVRVQFRPSYFPFTEPSAEVDISCVLCGGGGCRVCKQTGWLEIMGCGMVNPKVFESVKIDPEKYTGFAFGMGIERIAMLKYKIDDLRLFFENDVRFLSQF